MIEATKAKASSCVVVVVVVLLLIFIIIDFLFPINVFKGKINCHSIMDTVGIRMPTRQIREFSTFSVSSALRNSPSARCVIATNEILEQFWQKQCLF
jgi:hypothetical protein